MTKRYYSVGGDILGDSEAGDCANGSAKKRVEF
jgi:hypothetical protein